MASETEVAWAAGLFEGEGTVSVSGAWKRARLQMKMTDEDVIRRFCRIVGGRVHGPMTYDQSDGSIRRPFWMWTTAQGEAGTVAGLLWPWLGVRRRARFVETGLCDGAGAPNQPSLFQ
jgi:hypothetical protein